MERGRPTDYSDEIAETLLAEVATGISVSRACEAEGMPDKATVYRWMSRYPDFRDKYAKAKELASEALAEEIFDIADDNAFDYTEGKDGSLRVNNDAINRAKLRVDVRKWYLSKIVPKKYGERQQVEHSGNIELKSLSDEELTARLIALQNATPDS